MTDLQDAVTHRITDEYFQLTSKRSKKDSRLFTTTTCGELETKVDSHVENLQTQIDELSKTVNDIKYMTEVKITDVSAMLQKRVTLE